MINLQRGDCLELLKTIPDNSVDLVLTDPPYDVHAGKGGGAFGNRNSFKEIDPMSNGINDVVLDELLRVMKKLIFIFSVAKNKSPS